MVGEVGIGGGDGVARIAATDEFLGFQCLAVGGKDEAGLGFGSGGAGAQGLEGFADLAGGADGKVDVVAQQDAAGDLRAIAVAGAQPFERGFLVAEGGEEGIGEFRRIEGLKREIGYGLFDFYGVHGVQEGVP